jgi:hypothetical protein
MTAPRDPNELIRAYLDEGPLDLREQVYDEVRAEVDHTNQRTFFGPWRNLSVMSNNRFAGFAAVTLVIGGAPSASPSASPSVEPSVRPSVEPSVEPSAEASVDENLPPFVCGAPSLEVPAMNMETAPLLLGDVRIGGHEGYDRVVFEYLRFSATPELRVRVDEGPYLHDPSGLPLEVDGSLVYLLNINGATKYDQEAAELTYTGPTDFHSGLTQIVQLVESGDFEATNNWYLGVNGATCLRAFALLDPSRLVIDVQH